MHVLFPRRTNITLFGGMTDGTQDLACGPHPARSGYRLAGTLARTSPAMSPTCDSPTHIERRDLTGPDVHGARRLRAFALLLPFVIATDCARPAAQSSGTIASTWVATWQGPPQLTEPRNMPPAPGLADATLRQRLHPTLGGTRVRLRLSNEFGDGPLEISATRIALSNGDDTIDATTDRAILFSSRTSITIPPGEFAWSDEVPLAVPAFRDVAVSLYFARVPSALTGHPGSRTNSFIVRGNHAAEPDLRGDVRAEHWYVVSNVEVSAAAPAAAVVVLGNSIADGRGSTTDHNDRWPDNFARRLAADPRTAGVGVLNAGIGGNAVVRGGLGPTAVERLDRDVLQQRGARWLVVSEGVNDIGGARGADSVASMTRQLIAAYRAVIDRAHARGFRVYGATMLPFGGSQYSDAARESARQVVNAWIRTARAFDAVIDFDAAMRDPASPDRLLPSADGGDHLHPNQLGYRMMADVVDLTLFAR